MGVKSGGAWVIGIDGGGTKSTACLFHTTGKHLLRFEFAPTNYRADAVETIVASIAEVVSKLQADAGLPTGSRIQLLAACLSGLGRRDACNQIRSRLEQQNLAQQIVAASDAEAALFAAFGREPGIIIIAGTGSIAFARNRDGEILRCGGWGYLLGDEGSGFDIARQSIRAALMDWEGRGPKTTLRRRLQQELGVNSIDEAVTRLYSTHPARGALAQFALPVFTEARAGDPVARQIIARAAHDLAELASVLARKIDTPPPLPVALFGGLFRETSLVEQIERYWNEHKISVKRVLPRFSPDVGAGLLGCERINLPLSEAALTRLQSALAAAGWRP